MLSPGCTPLLGTDPLAIGRYRILGRLGTGGMATVFLAESDAGTRVALKLIHEHLAADAEFLARFERETQLAARVPAHCTAALLDKGVQHDRPYLVTEYLAGAPLHRLVQTEGPLDAASTHNIAVGLAAGLTAIHDCDLVHRDIKPSNVIVTRGGVRIIDFGIARTLDTSTNFTGSGFMMGSLGWASPEQLEGRSPRPAMDVFAWGCVLAYAATGRHPFGGDDSVARSWRVLNAEPDLSGVPDTVVELVAAALARDAASRPTAQELLLGLVGGAGPVVRVRAAAPARAEASGRAPRRSRWALLMAAVPVGVVAVVALSGATGSGVMLDRPAYTTPPATAESPQVGTGSTGTPAGNGRPGSTGGQGGTGGQSTDPVTPGESQTGSTATATPTAAGPGNNGNGQGNGNGNSNKPSKKPKG